MRVYPDETALIIIDYQTKLVPVMYDSEKFVRNSSLLVQGMLELDIPVIMTQQYTRGLGGTIEDIADIDGVPDAFDKISFSCMADEDIYIALNKLNVKNVVICGCEAHICVLQTVIDLLAEEYNVYVVRNCVASRKEEDKEAAILRAAQEGAYITTYEAILFELLGRAGSEQFKNISRLIK